MIIRRSMKIAYITDNFTGQQGNGISEQAKKWAEILNKFCSLNVELVNPWESHNWNDEYIIHLFGSGGTWFYNTAKELKKKGNKVVWSPICDNIDSPKVQKLKACLGNERLGIYSYPFARKLAYKVFDKIFVRSEYEKEYIKAAYSVPEEKISLVPLSISYSDNEKIDLAGKEQFCLHISSISQPRKNVLNLVRAAKKYGFRLILAGNKGGKNEYSIIEKEIGDANNIKVLGFISEEEKIGLYRRAKVFALPSIYEGVGIVAMDAAHFGCDVVITKTGGPCEYYDNLAKIINPYNVDEIGTSVMELMKTTYQPQLKHHIDNMYAPQTIAKRLFGEYKKL